MLNVVAGGIGKAAAVLIRSVEAVSGPARLTAALGIDRALNGCEASVRAGLWFSEEGREIPAKRILRTSRIGVEYAGPVWARKKLRFVLAKREL